MVLTVEYSGKSYKVPSVSIKKRDDAAQMVDLKLQKRRLSKLKSSISRFAREAGDEITPEQISEIIKLMKIPDGYLPQESKDKPVTETASEVTKSQIPQTKNEQSSFLKEEASLPLEGELKAPVPKKKGKSPAVNIIKRATTEIQKEDSPLPLKLELEKEDVVKIPLSQSRRELFA